MEEPPTKACSNWVARKEHTHNTRLFIRTVPKTTVPGSALLPRQVCCNSYFNKPRRGAGSCPHPARLAARPALPSAPGPLLTAPDNPAPRPAAALRPTRIPASRRPPAPRSAQTAAQGEGRRGPRVPGAAARPLPAPQLSRLPRLNSSRRLPPAARSSPYAGAATAATPVPGLVPELGRSGPGAPPGRCRGAWAVGGGRAGPLPPRGGGPARPGGGSARRYLHSTRSDPASATPPAAILEKERKRERPGSLSRAQSADSYCSAAIALAAERRVHRMTLAERGRGSIWE